MTLCSTLSKLSKLAYTISLISPPEQEFGLEFAKQFPSAVIKGTDLSALQPYYVPPNCDFEVDGAEDTWVYSHKFDYIHGRMLITCFQFRLVVFKLAFVFFASSRTYWATRCESSVPWGRGEIGRNTVSEVDAHVEGQIKSHGQRLESCSWA